MRYILLSIIILLLSCAEHLFAQNAAPKMASEIAKAKALADTSSFTPNAATGWSIFSSYVNTASNDSVVLETTIAHDRDINWDEYQHFGTIKSSKLSPRQTQEVAYYLLQDAYSIKVDERGNCFVKLVSGQLPPRDPIILPINITYKRK